MKTSELLSILEDNPESTIHIMLPDGDFVEPHFHVTEVGRVTKKFIDCGGTRRSSDTCLLQIWVSSDIYHRLNAAKLSKILRLADDLGLEDLSVEFEYEKWEFSQYPLGGVEITPSGLLLGLGLKHTTCLAPDKCGVSGCC